MQDSGFNTSSQSGVGKFSNLQKNQVFKDRGAFGNKDTFGNKDVYGNKNIWKQDDVYGRDDQREVSKYLRFSDLKILNENMMHMSNNTLSDDSRIEILSQGEKGEIKNILAYRMLKISIVPALMSLLFGLVVVLTDSFLITLFALFVFLGVMVRTFFYPAKLYYQNIRYKTTLPARAFYEEMDYWYKISVVKIYIYLIIVSIFMFVISFYEDELVEFCIELIVSSPTGLGSDNIKNYLATISFSLGLKIIAFLNIALLIFYSKFTNKEKSVAESELREKMKRIRNETLSRVQQIQEDKNETN